MVQQERRYSPECVTNMSPMRISGRERPTSGSCNVMHGVTLWMVVFVRHLSVDYGGRLNFVVMPLSLYFWWSAKLILWHLCWFMFVSLFSGLDALANLRKLFKCWTERNSPFIFPFSFLPVIFFKKSLNGLFMGFSTQLL